MNGDGFGDLAVGGPLRYNAHRQDDEAGIVEWFAGSPAGLSHEPDWSVKGQAEDGELGWVLASGGDVDGDGFDDVLVTEHRVTTGNMMLFSGSPHGLKHDTTWVYEEIHSDLWDSIGVSTALGDFDGDGRADVLAGIGGYSSDRAYEQGEGAAAVFLTP
jgi:hypothetical protein